MGERTDRQLGNEPDQVGGQAAMHRGRPHRRLVPLERRDQQRAGVEPRLTQGGADMVSRFAGAAVRQVLTELGQCRTEQGHRQRNRLTDEGRHAGRELGGEIVGWQRQPRQRPTFNRLGEPEDDPQQLPLEFDRRRQIRPLFPNRCPPGRRRLQPDLRRDRRQNDVGHGN